jgi:oligogalacturonide lyase
LGKGTIYPPEGMHFIDEQTGVSIRQITTAASIHHPPFYYIPAYDDAMQRLCFVSHRTGRPEIFVEQKDTGKLLQLTSRPDITEWSLHPSHDGRYIYFTAGSGCWRVETETLKEEELVRFPEAAMRGEGMVGAGTGTTALSHDDRYWAVVARVKEQGFRFVVIDTETGNHNVILERETIGHPEFHPDDSKQLRYAGPYSERIWIIRRDGGDHRLVYRRDEEKKEWIVHETWLPGTREILTTHWPHGVLRIHVDTGSVYRICTFNAWHAMVDRAGRRMVADTVFPDIGLQLFDIKEGISKPETLCRSLSSNVGDHWNTDHCPYDDGPVDVYAPQHTHPHPNFSPGGTRVVFTSDRTGFAQIYEVIIDQPK